MTETTEPEVVYAVQGGVARVTINRPGRRNSMSYGVMQGLRDAFAAAKADADVRVVVLTGAGEKAFCAGADLGGIADNAGAAAAHDGRGLLANLFREMWALGKPIVARVRGFALAGGFGLALACDVVIAADDAQFGTPEVNVGLWPYMITVPMLRSMPAKTVLELQMTGRRVSAHEGLRMGFVNRVVAVDELDVAVDEFASSLAAKSPLVLRWGRDAFYRVLEMDADRALDYLQGMLTVHTQSEDAAEGVAAFAEKRDPVWKGR
jgi:enoyl-CoA hydratase/carnithine racemase